MTPGQTSVQQRSQAGRRPDRSATARPAPRTASPFRRHAALRVGILGTGAAVPPDVLANSDLERRVDTSDEWIRTRTGMRERRIAAPGLATSDLAAAAARRALRDAGLAPEDLELILVATATPDHTATPSTACLVQSKIGAVRAAGFDVSAACSGFVTALMTARQFLASGAFGNALVIGADLLSRITDYQDRETCVLFGDGAGAVVLHPRAERGEILDQVIGMDGSGADLIKVEAGGSRRPASVETVMGRNHFLRLHGREVFRFAVNKLCELVETLLERNGLSLTDLGLVVPHQANLRILEAAAKKLGLSMDKVYVNIERYGNTSSGSVPIALHEAAQSGRLHEGDLVCAAAFGGGLTWGATLLRW